MPFRIKLLFGLSRGALREIPRTFGESGQASLACAAIARRPIISTMPLLGFVARRSTSSSRDATSIKEQLRKVAAKGPSTSTLSVQAGLFGHVEEFSHMENIKRHSIGGMLKADRRGSGSSQKLAAYKPAKLWLTVESPPLVSLVHPCGINLEEPFLLTCSPTGILQHPCKLFWCPIFSSVTRRCR